MVSEDASWTHRFDEVWQNIYKQLIELKEARDAELRSLGHDPNPTKPPTGAPPAIESGNVPVASRNLEDGSAVKRLEGGRDGEAGRSLVAVRTGLPVVGQARIEAPPPSDKPGKQAESGEARIGEARDDDLATAENDLAPPPPPPEEKGERSGLEVLGDDKYVVKDEGRKVRDAEGVEVNVFGVEVEERWSAARCDDGRGEIVDGSKREPKLEDNVSQDGEATRKRKRDVNDEDLAAAKGMSRNGKRKTVSFRTRVEEVDSDADSEQNDKSNKVTSTGNDLDQVQKRSSRRVAGDDADEKYLNGGRLGAEEDHNAVVRVDVVAPERSPGNQVGTHEVPKEVSGRAAKYLSPGPGGQGLSRNDGASITEVGEGSRDVHEKPGSLIALKVEKISGSDVTAKSVVADKSPGQPNLNVLTTAAAAFEADNNVGSAEVGDVMSIEAADELVPSNLSSEDGELAEQAMLIKSLKGSKRANNPVLVAEQVMKELVSKLADFFPPSVLGASRDGLAALALSLGLCFKNQQEALEKERKLNKVLKADLLRNHSEKERLQQEKEKLCAHLSSIATTVEEGSTACSYCQSILSQLSEESFQDAFKTVSNGGGQLVPFDHQHGAFGRDGNRIAQSPLSSSSDGPHSANRKVVDLSDDEKEEISEPQLSNGKDVSGSSSGGPVPIRKKRRMEDVMEEDKPARHSRRAKERDAAELKPLRVVRSIHDKAEVRRSRRLSAKDYDQDLVEVDIKEMCEEDEATDDDEDIPEPKMDEDEEERDEEDEQEEEEMEEEVEEEEVGEAEEEEEDRDHRKRQSVKEVSKRLKLPKGRIDVQPDSFKRSASKARRHEESFEDEKGEEKELIRRLKARTAKKEVYLPTDRMKEKTPLTERHANGTAPLITTLSVARPDLGDQGPREEPELEFKCGCTSSKYGDTVGHVKVYKSGDFVLFCECKPGCSEAGLALTPAAFERHAGRGSSKKWKNTIWVMMGDDKVPIAKVKALEPYYKKYKVRKNLKVLPSTTQGTGGGGAASVLPPSVTHRDEFVKCCKCRKERRFKRRNKEECRLYHDAMLNRRWECANLPDERYARCGEDEEREVRRALKGCPRIRNCPGCAECVCLGCLICRFGDCTCRTCSEFMANNAVRFV